MVENDANPGAETEDPSDAEDPTDTEGSSEEGTDPAEPRCDYCRLPIPSEPVAMDHGGVTYRFCTQACRDALVDSDRVFTSYHGFRQFRPGVRGIDSGLPEGMPRNAFVLLSGMSGTRDEAVQAELVWRALQRGESVVVVSFLETPTSLIQQFVGLEWNVLPYLESGRLHVLDCFTYRLDDAEGLVERMNEFNAHLYDVVSEAITTVRDPTNLTLVRSRLDDCLGALGMNDGGIVVIDSLTELGSLVQPVKAYEFVKGVRADVPKGRFVPVFAGATRTGDAGGFPHDLEYMVDGVVDLRFTDGLAEDTLIKQLRIRKMAGVLTIPEWHTYEYTSEQGQVLFDVEAEKEKAREERAAEGEKADAPEGAALREPATDEPPADATLDREEAPVGSDPDGIEGDGDG